MRQYFSLSEFRPQPQNDAGGSLQRDVTVAGLRGENLLAILPTGAGKSMCYQLPALAHYWRTGKLTVIVSPLQSLMKDQVDNLVKRGIYCAVALNGLLTPPERRSALDKIRLGDAGIVLVSPEQFRNKSLRRSDPLARDRDLGVRRGALPVEMGARLPHRLPVRRDASSASATGEQLAAGRLLHGHREAGRHCRPAAALQGRAGHRPRLVRGRA